MKLSEIGEFGLIKLLAKEFGIEYPPSRASSAPGFLVGLGDDAVVTGRRDGALIWTTDTMVEGNHFRPGDGDWSDVGWRALASNVSDIAAMGGTPAMMLVTLTLPPEFCVEDAVTLYQGLHECAQRYDVSLGGGDIVRSPVFSITIALSGWAYTPALGQPRVLRRDTARPGDVVAVTGNPGDSAGGLRLILSESSFDTDAEKQLRRAHLRPRPKVATGQAAVRAGLRCGIDVSDGLVQDLGHVATASGVRVTVEAEKLPLSDALRTMFGDEAFGLAISGGEDYELVVIGRGQAIASVMAESDERLTVIGRVEASEAPGVQVIDAAGNEIEPPRRGWDHFRTT